MTQRFSFWEDLSIRENLDFVARLYEMKDRQQAVVASLKGLGLIERQDQLAGALSGGWKQRLALAACMLHRPELLLLDEPTAGVDPGARREFWDEIHALAAGGISVLVSTHYMDEAERCHKLAYIAYGRLMTQGTSQEIIDGQKLSTWEVTGENLAALADHLRGKPGVEQVAAFGSALHVTGRDSGALKRTIDEITSNTKSQAKPAATGLEDVFIHLTEQATDNYGVQGKKPQ
jgi:ABC-2 type transport system ATP-binding protein